ncbi:MAG: carbohydrate kinase family protein [Amnibacterium sp.]
MSASPAGARVIVGTGGIGAGITLELIGNRDLGREESRPVRRLDARDSCKLHIVFHYLQRLVGDRSLVLPIGRVGEDEAGDTLLRELTEVGLPTRYVARAAAPTLYSVAFVYPDGDGGNLTTVDSASSAVSARDIRAAEAELPNGAGIAVALPEVPLAARIELLTMAGEHDAFRIASFVPDEAEDPDLQHLLDHVDLLALNSDEAAALCGGDPTGDGDTLLGRLRTALADRGRTPQLVLTCGLRGSWSWDGEHASHADAIPRPVRSTAGAGDAHLAGVITGLVAGSSLAAANGFAALVSSLKVASAHTIHPDLGWPLLEQAGAEHGIPLPEGRQ